MGIGNIRVAKIYKVLSFYSISQGKRVKIKNDEIPERSEEFHAKGYNFLMRLHKKTISK